MSSAEVMDMEEVRHARADQTLREALLSVDLQRGVRMKRDELSRQLETMSSDNAWLFKETLRYAYDCGIRFGISPDTIETPCTVPREPRDFGSWVFTMLDEVRVETRPSAKKAIIEEKLGTMSETGVWLLTSIIGKDLRCGINESTINKAFKDLLTTFDVMLAKPFAARNVPSWPMLIEPKLDGLRVIAEADTASKKVTFFTRSGKKIDSLNDFKSEVNSFALQFATEETPLPTVAFDGEVTSGSFLESMSQVRSSSEQVKEGTFHVFDVLVRGPGHSPIALSDAELEEQGTQKERRARLTKGYLSLLKHVPKPSFVKLTEQYAVGSEDEVFAVYNRCRDANLEGVIVKDPNAFYVKKRSASWMKIKAQETLDLPIVGAFEGTGKYAGMLGGLIVDHEGVNVSVGSGFSDDQRKEYWEQILADQAFIAAGNRSKCRLIDCPAEVQFQEKMPSGSLRHPVFVRLRRDKQLGMVGAF